MMKDTYRCPNCNAPIGMTRYVGEVCEKCGFDLSPKFR